MRHALSKMISRPATGLLLGLLLLVLLTPTAHAQRGRADQFTKDVEARLTEILAKAKGDQKAMQGAYGELLQLGDTVSARAGARQGGAMVRCEGALGMLELVIAAKAEDPGATVAIFTQHERFMTELGLLYSQEHDRARDVVRIARQLMTERSKQVDQFPALAAAVCVVHDLPEGRTLTMRVNENSPEGPSALEVFDFFASNASSMHISPDRLPALALIYVVDVTQPIEELQWAHNIYSKSPGIDQRFKEIEYDHDHASLGKKKRVTAADGPYGLRKIKQHGGVCADQAYYAMSVAKASGLPSAYVVARGADVGHAWVGFAEARGRRISWNFDSGRYEQYQKLRGNIANPQTNELVSDGRVGIIGGAMGARNDDVLATLATARVVGRMNAGYWRPSEKIELDDKGNQRQPITDEIGDRLKMLRSALSDCAGVPGAWDRVTELARTGALEESQMDVWAKAVTQLAGREHLDFAYDFLVDLIGSVEDPQRQHEMWEWAFSQFRTRPDLAAGVRFKQGELWSKNDNPEYAWLAYKDVVDRFINEGPMPVAALEGMRQMLRSHSKEADLIPVLETAARRVQRPQQELGGAFATQSNFYKINSMLADLYESVGRGADAKRLRDQIKL